MNIRQIIAQDLRGHAYIAARGLTPSTQRREPQTYAEAIAPWNEMLPSIQAICKAERERRKIRRAA